MKKVLLFLILLTGIGLAQTNGKLVGDGVVWTDSLGYTNLDETSDSILTIDMNFSKGWINVFVKGNANSPVDSFYVQAGSVRYSQNGVPKDTVWGSWVAIKDSSWTDINTMINNTVGKDFLFFRPVTQLLQFTLLNARANLVTRNCVLTIQGKK